MKTRRNKKSKSREISPKQARKALWKQERLDAGLAATPPATKVADSFPLLQKAKICRMCANQADCEMVDAALTECSDFARCRAAKPVELLPIAKKPTDYHHQNKKAYALANYRNQLLAQWQFCRAEMQRLEAEIALVEKDIHRAVVVKETCAPYNPPSKLFRDSLPDKPEATAKVAKVAKASNKTGWADLELD